MASSEDPRKRALQDEDDEARSGLDPASQAGPDDDASADGQDDRSSQWGGKTELQDSTQVAGRPAFTSDDPTGFGETTQAMRFDGQSGADDLELEGDPTRATSDWTASTPPEDETRPGRAGGTQSLDADDAAGFSSTGGAGSFESPGQDEDAPHGSSSGGLPEFGASGSGASFDFGAPGPTPGSEVTDPGHSAGSNPQADIPAHLQLPTMDFTLPKLPDLGGLPPSDFSGSDLPPNLQLPNFPDLGLGLPPLGVPGEEGSAPGDAPPQGPAGHTGAEAGPPSTPPRRKTGDAPPPPPPRRGTGVDEPLPTAFGMPSDLKLPDFAPPPSKRNLTLISMPQDSSDDDAPRRVIWPFIVIAVLAAATVAGIWQKDRILAVMVPKQKPPAPVVVAPTPQEQAKAAFAAGVHAFGTKEYPKAIESFEKAVALDGTLADAHRSLGIVYATTHEQAKAVDHYRRYLELTPKASDAAAVQKIVDDYAKAQAKPATPPPAPEEPEKAAKQKGKKAKGKRR